MRKLELTLIFLCGIFFVAGCIRQQPSTVEYKEYKNDIITAEGISVSNLRPYAGSQITFEGEIKNNGDKMLDVETMFFNIQAIENINITYCDEPAEKKVTINSIGCIFKNVEPFETRRIILNGTTFPNIISPMSFSISYSIRYNVTGYRIATIPIIDETTRKTPLSSFTLSKPSIGPLVLNIDTPISRERKVGEKIIKESWAIKDQPFEVKFSFEDVVGKGIATIYNLRINMTDLMVYDPSLCDFNVSGDQLILNKDIRVAGKSETFMCYFISKDMTKPEVSAIISAEFNYTYEFGGSQSFTILPKP